MNKYYGTVWAMRGVANDRNMVNTLRMEQMYDYENRELYSTDQRTFSLMLPKTSNPVARNYREGLVRPLCCFRNTKYISSTMEAAAGCVKRQRGMENVLLFSEG